MKTLTAPERASELLRKGEAINIVGNALIEIIQKDLTRETIKCSSELTLGPFGTDTQLIISAISLTVNYGYETRSDANDLFPGRLWLSPDYGNDTTGRRNREDRPFKTFRAVYEAANDRDAIFCITGKSENLNGKETSILIEKSIFVYGMDQFNNPGSNGFSNFAITINIDNVDNYGAVFRGINFVNTALDDVPVTVTSAVSHEVLFDKCYFARTTGNKIAFQTSGAWAPKSTGNQPAQVVIRNTPLVGKINCSHGTPGAPFDRQGIVLIDDLRPLSWPGYSSELVVNSGMVEIRGSRTPCITLNGGAIVVKDPHFVDLMTGNIAINAANSTLGSSFLYVSDFLQSGLYRDPTEIYPKINVGANVVFHIDGVLDPASISIDPAAVKLRNYAVQLGKNPLIRYNSSETA